MNQSEADQARAFAGEVTALITTFENDSSLPDARKAVDYLKLMHAELLEFAADPDDERLRQSVAGHITHFIDLTRRAAHRA
ncbi:hypothetical protein ABZ023_35120 [Streptomyces sp. NPDC006367]|uniref:hypothetical protein n=1 Tax=unclassified Streptomyces TaxID=2593676 RepID=UPI0033A333DB